MKNIKKNIPSCINFGQRLKMARKKARISQVEFAKNLGYKRNVSISNIESGRTPPSVPTLAKMADILKVDLHWLITGKPSPMALKYQKDFEIVIYKLAAYVSRSLADCLQSKAVRQEELNEELEKQTRGENVEADFIDSLRSEIAIYEREINELTRDQPWLEKAIKSYEEIASVLKIGKDKKI